MELQPDASIAANRPFVDGQQKKAMAAPVRGGRAFMASIKWVMALGVLATSFSLSIGR
jgi:hypothetical protein